MQMIKKRLGPLAARLIVPALALAAVGAAYVSMPDAPALMTAATTRELPVYNVETEEKVLSISLSIRSRWWDRSRSRPGR